MSELPHDLRHDDGAHGGVSDFPAGIEKILGYTFRDSKVLRHALTHSSSTTGKFDDNERLEFFGDSILDFIVCEHLFCSCPTQREGELTEVKSAIVRRKTLARAADRLDLRPYLILGKGISQRDSLPMSVYANVFEALVAAIYIDGGMVPAREFVMRCLKDEFDRAHRMPHVINFKSILQQELQKDQNDVPEYRVIREVGPDHSKTFTVAVFFWGDEQGRGSGESKKEAEQRAAEDALARMEQLLEDEGEDDEE
ncbi:MAG: ribonuclease III [Planctomycetes bacterium]|nr:ribonuclease III [Planctomycetota bacterium]